jgi:DNA-binding SARP family transcriptional activator/tetratricopeptide (TPR) repeat protein
MLSVRVLGELAVDVDGSPLPAPASRRAWALLGYLALHDGPVPRGHLAARFWPDVLDASARASLRSAVWALRKALGDGREDHVIATRDHVGLHDVEIDRIRFEELIDAGDLEAALGLVRGGLLDGIDEEWTLVARDDMRDRLAGVHRRLAAGAAEAGDAAGAVRWARAEAALDPLSEDAHRHLMERLVAAGDRSAALTTAARLGERLRRELGVAPSLVTRELAAALRADAPDDADLPEEPLPDPGRQATARGPLIGRDAELAGLVSAWRSARDGNGGGVAIVHGEAGIGKSRLVTELAAHARAGGGRVASCGTLELGAGAPFALWTELLRELTRAARVPPPADAAWPRDLAALTPELAASAPGRAEAPPELERARLFEAVVALVEWAAAGDPLLLVMEDLHVADGSSLELAGYVARRLSTLPVLLVATHRDHPRRDDLAALVHALRARDLVRAELALRPLDGGTLDTMVRACVDDLHSDQVARAVSAADGNPLLALEGGRALARGADSLSSGLHGAVRARTTRLDESARELVALLAVAGGELDIRDLATLVDPPLAAAVTAAIDADLAVAEEGRVRFRHALLRDAVYEDMPQHERAERHERCARALERRGRRDAEVARHLTLAGREDLAVGALTRVGMQARKLGALAESRAYFEQALAIDPDDAALWLELGDVHAWAGDREESDRCGERALALLPEEDPLERARAHLRIGLWYHGPLCVPPEVLTRSTQALRELDVAGLPAPAERREALSSAAWAEAVAGDPDRADERLLELEELADETDLFMEHSIEHARALALMRRGRMAESIEHGRRAGELSSKAGRPDLAYGGWLNAAGAKAALGDFEGVLELIDIGAAAVGGNGLLVVELQMLGARAWTLTRLGRFDEARAAAEGEARIARRLDDEPLRILAAQDGGMVELEAGEPAAAEHLLAQGCAPSRWVSRPLALLAHAEALAKAGRADEAEARLREVTGLPLRPSDFPATLVARLARIQGLIAAARDDVELAERRLREALDGWNRLIRGSDPATDYMSVLVDLGRPLVGVVEPQREIDRITAELVALPAPV